MLAACPDETKIAEFVAHALPGALTTTIEEHIADCDDCRNLVFALAGTSSGSMPSAPAAEVEDYRELVPVEVGHYVLGDQIARGGMGRIRVARDRRLGRTVAIKEILDGGADARMRFEREVRITARLQHPSIVDVHEAGAWPTGEPFFAMKLVSGRSLDKVIGEATTLDARLALLPNVLAVADAIAYAHRERVIHRDLKPQNILVGSFGEVVVIDWGLAKDLTNDVPDLPHGGEPAPQSGEQTVAGRVIGTLAYMPPEQALGQSVDERADVYALGALLFHLLAGRPPVIGSTAQEMLAMIVDGPPVSLSEVQPGVPADLLAIVHKAMAHEAADRYPTARELAEDLRRFQTGQLVGAHRYSTGQRARRWLRRHRTAAVASSAALAVLLAVGGVSLARILRAERVAETERALAVEHRADAEELMTFMLGDLREKLAPVGKLELLDAVAKKAKTYYDRRTVSRNPKDSLNRAVVQRNLGAVLHARGDLAAASAQYRGALAIAEALAVADPTNPAAQRELAAAWVALGDALADQGDARAMAAYRGGLAIREQLAKRSPTDRNLQIDLSKSHDRFGDALAAEGDFPGALSAYRASLAIRDKLAAIEPADITLQDMISVNHQKIGNALVDQGDLPGALAAHNASLAIAEKVSATDPSNTTWQYSLSISHESVGDDVRDQGDTAQALVHYRASLAIRERLAAVDPKNADWQRTLSISYAKVGEVLNGTGHPSDALAPLRAAGKILDELVAADPTDINAARFRAINHHDIANVFAAQGKASAALAEYRAALALRLKLVAANPTSDPLQHDLWDTHIKLGAALRAGRDFAGALEQYRAALPIAEKLAAAAPTNTERRRIVAGTHEAIADNLRGHGHEDAALVEYRAALTMLEQLAAAEPANERLQGNVALVRNKLGKR